MTDLDPSVQVALITTGGAILLAGITALFKMLSDILSHAKAARHEVQNSHTTNLRDDLDRMHADVRLALTELGGLRTDLRQERDERLAVAERLDAHVATHAAA